MAISSTIVCLAAVLPTLTDGSAVELHYTGTLTSTARGQAESTVKQFSLFCLYTPKKTGAALSFVVEEQGGGGWSWPERYGQISLDKQFRPAGKIRIRLLHTFQGSKYPITVRQPIFESPDKLADEAEWQDGKRKFVVVHRKKIGDHNCRQVEVSGRIGRAQTVWIPVGSPIIVKSQQVVFMGRGDRFRLDMVLKSSKTLSATELAKLQKPLTALLTAKSILKRKEYETRPELSEDQLKAVLPIVKTLSKDAESTPFHRLATFIKGDLALQSQRDGQVTDLAKRYVGKKAPKFTLRDLTGKAIDSKEAAGKIVVLHFWDYRGEPLEEPYGQVGYLDFLNSKRGKLGVKIYGVAVDSRFADRTKTTAALRSVRKLKSFMNLSYPITRDDGSLLRTFGDPRRVDAKLPLWVVLDHSGKVRLYKTGFYKIRPDEGLRPLDSLLIKLIREQRTK